MNLYIWCSGQWHMLVNVIEKYGLVPKKVFPDTWNSENTRRMNAIINNKVSEVRNWTKSPKYLEISKLTMSVTKYSDTVIMLFRNLRTIIFYMHKFVRLLVETNLVQDVLIQLTSVTSQGYKTLPRSKSENW